MILLNREINSISFIGQILRLEESTRSDLYSTSSKTTRQLENKPRLLQVKLVDLKEKKKKRLQNRLSVIKGIRK